MEHIKTGDWSGNSFSGEVPKININIREPIELDWDEIDRIFAKVLLRKRIEQAPTLLRDMIINLVLGFIMVVISSVVIGENYMNDIEVIPIAFVVYFAGIIAISYSISEMQEPLLVIRNKDKYEKYLD